MDTFKVGDTVILKSGGPTMTVVGVEGGEAVATWFPTLQAMPATASFPFAALNKA